MTELLEAKVSELARRVAKLESDLDRLISAIATPAVATAADDRARERFMAYRSRVRDQEAEP